MRRVKLKEELLERLCDLAGLRLDAEEKQRLKASLEEVLSHFEKISSLNTNGIPALSNSLEQEMKLREDRVVEKGPDKKQMLDGVPNKQGNLVRVPPTV